MNQIYAKLPPAWRNYVHTFLDLAWPSIAGEKRISNTNDYESLCLAIHLSGESDALSYELAMHLEQAFSYYAEDQIKDGQSLDFDDRETCKLALEILKNNLPIQFLSSSIKRIRASIVPNLIPVCEVTVPSESVLSVYDIPEFRIQHYSTQQEAFNGTTFCESPPCSSPPETEPECSSSEVELCDSSSIPESNLDSGYAPSIVDTIVSDFGEFSSNSHVCPPLSPIEECPEPVDPSSVDFCDTYLSGIMAIPFSIVRVMKSLPSHFRQIFRNALDLKPISMWEWRALCSKIYLTIKYIPARVIRQSLRFLVVKHQSRN